MKIQELPLCKSPKTKTESESSSKKLGIRNTSWWTPVYSGLVVSPEGKHRSQMGPAIWVYLYLITYAKRKTGIAHRNVGKISEETGMSARSIHRHLNRLETNGYIRFVERRPILKIQITKWKNFGKHNVNGSKTSETHRLNSPEDSQMSRTLERFSH
ncbi:MAG: helix-turn-helix domain-containing protein [Acidobacteria bacterium]|nr:MAG: helix-turn-helix domain-containing protein [Acidobacteriota bacterium]REJ98283.1 MAG: helix-turn-helix domain-containing protein [Acidobacteriota bacterium]REK17027.1 MAG: helix-turn-helix domain-containing protein [Acidobacteriota bacterium]REK42937.1 MAG: helix-turn-helix domain-containing protein [Acidobacteriota bacterium]